MKLIWLLVAKDLRSQRSLLWLWLALLASKYVLGCALLWTDGTASLRRFETIAEVAQWLQHLERVGAVLAAAMVLEDPLVGERVFWRTRPIAGWRLLAAKALGLSLVFLALPVLVGFPWWLICEYRVSDLVAATAETIAFHVPVVGAAWAVAVVSESLPHAVGRAFIAFGAAIGAGMLAAQAGETGQSPVVTAFDVPPSAVWLIFLGGAGALILHQYLRRHRAGAVWFAVLVVSTSSVAFVWGLRIRCQPLPEVGLPSTTSDASSNKVPTAASPDAFQVDAARLELFFRYFDPARTYDLPANPSEADLFDRRALLELELVSLGPREWVEFESGTLQWTLPDGTIEHLALERGDARLALSSAVRRLEVDGAAERRGHERVRAVGRPPGRRSTHEVLPDSARWRATFRQRAVRSSETVLSRPGVWTQGTRRAHWSQTAERARMLSVRRCASPGQPDRGIAWSDLDSEFRRLALPSGRLIAPSRGYRATRIGTVLIAWEEVRFEAPAPTAGRAAASLAEARLVEVTIEEVRTFEAGGAATSITRGGDSERPAR